MQLIFRDSLLSPALSAVIKFRRESRTPQRAERTEILLVKEVERRGEGEREREREGERQRKIVALY